MGSAGMIEASIAELQRRGPEDFERLFRSDHWLRLGLTAFEKRLENAERDAVLAWLQAVKAIEGDKGQAVVVFCSGMGVADPGQVRRLVEIAQRADGATVLDARREAIALLRGIMRASPSERVTIREELFGEREVATEVRAEANGGNGNGDSQHAV